jgi:hypothetical protein
MYVLNSAGMAEMDQCWNTPTSIPVDPKTKLPMTAVEKVDFRLNKCWSLMSTPKLKTTELAFIQQSWDKDKVDLNEFFAMKVLTPTNGKTKPTIKTKSGLREPTAAVIKLTATTTYLDLYKAQYAYYKKEALFPKQSLQRDRSLSGNAGQCLAFCNDGFASVSGVCQPCVEPCATCRHEVQRCLTCDQNQP